MPCGSNLECYGCMHVSGVLRLTTLETITRGEIIELNVRIETRMAKISFFACFCSFSDSRITILNHYSRQFDPYFEMLRALAGKH